MITVRIAPDSAARGLIVGGSIPHFVDGISYSGVGLCDGSVQQMR